MLQTPYVISVAYTGTIVLIDSDVPTRSSLPVRTVNAYGMPIREPSIEQIRAQVDPSSPVLDQPIFPGMLLVLDGSDLAGDVTRVRVGGLDATPVSVSADRIVVPIPAGL